MVASSAAPGQRAGSGSSDPGRGLPHEGIPRRGVPWCGAGSSSPRWLASHHEDQAPVYDAGPPGTSHALQIPPLCTKASMCSVLDRRRSVSGTPRDLPSGLPRPGGPKRWLAMCPLGLQAEPGPAGVAGGQRDLLRDGGAVQPALRRGRGACISCACHSVAAACPQSVSVPGQASPPPDRRGS